MDAVAVKLAAVQLCQRLNNQGWLCRHLQPQLSNAKALEQACLEEAIALRDAQQPALSLELLATAEQLGLESGWLQDNRARALVDLGQRQEAQAIWEALKQADDSGLAAAAEAMAAEQERIVFEALDRLCARQGWHPKQWNSASKPLMERILLELISCRELGRAQLSLELAECAEALGWCNGWLLDNKARALVEVGRTWEGVELWRRLAACGDGALAELAQPMLDLYRSQAEADEEIELLQRGEREALQQLLLQRLKQDPSDRDRLLRLGQLLDPSASDRFSLVDQELEQERQVLRALQALKAELVPA